MHTFLALLRGVNVGGKAKLPMAELRTALTAGGLADVRTYIQSGNVIFSSAEHDTNKLEALIKEVIAKGFRLDVDVAVFSRTDWAKIIANAPDWWGKGSEWKHNLIVMIKPYDMQQVIAAIGTLKPDIEAMQPGDGVIYQSMSIKLFGRTTTGNLASSPVYKRMTIRGYNTATKLLGLLQ